MFEGLHFTPVVPLNDSGNKSPTYGNKYLAGYVPIKVDMPGGSTLYFSGVTTLPLDRPHLVSTGEFLKDKQDDFIVGLGAPVYPNETLPANSFHATGSSQESKSSQLITAVACSIVGSMNNEYQMSIPGGFLAIRNGPSNPPNIRPATKELDIFSNELANGISTNGKVFANGYDKQQ